MKVYEFVLNASVADQFPRLRLRLPDEIKPHEAIEGSEGVDIFQGEVSELEPNAKGKLEWSPFGEGGIPVPFVLWYREVKLRPKPKAVDAEPKEGV